MHDFETIEKSYFTIDFIFAGSIVMSLWRNFPFCIIKGVKRTVPMLL